MADTVIIRVVSSSWTEIPHSSGFVTNETNKKVVYRESGSLPDVSVFSGHTLEDLPGGFFQFELVTGQRLYARSVGGIVDIAVTPGD